MHGAVFGDQRRSDRTGGEPVAEIDLAKHLPRGIDELVDVASVGHWKKRLSRYLGRCILWLGANDGRSTPEDRRHVRYAAGDSESPDFERLYSFHSL